MATSLPNEGSLSAGMGAAAGHRNKLLSLDAFSRITAGTLRGLYAILGVTAIFALSYLLGYRLLEGQLFGNDIFVGLLPVEWFNRWFPDIAIWFPLQGAGTPYPILYPTAPSIMAVVLHRLSGLTTVQAFRLLGFLSVPITATGIYFLVWRKLRSQTAAILGGLFYLLSIASWDWLFRIGLYAQSVSLMFFPWTFILFDAYLSGALDRSDRSLGFRFRLTFLAASLMFGLLFVMHPRTGVSFAMAIVLYALLLPLFHSERSRPWRRVPTSFLRAMVGIIAGLAIASFWLLPLINANSLANREGLSYNAWDLVAYYDFAATLGLTPPPSDVYLMTFAIPVLLLGGVGLLAGLIRRKVPFVWGVISISSVLFVAMPGIWPGFVKAFGMLWSRVMDRPVLIAFILIPAVAAYGALAPADLIVSLPGRLVKAVTKNNPVPRPLATIGGLLRKTLTALLAIAIAFLLVLQLQGLETRNGYGPSGTLPFEYMDGEIVFANPPLFELSKEGDYSNREYLQNLIGALGLDEHTRLDVSPNYGAITQRLGLYTDASMVNIYNYQASIIHSMWGYQQGLFFGHTEADPLEIDELAKWFGIQYVVLHTDYDSTEKYDPATWHVVYPEEGDGQGALEVRQFLEAPSMASLLNAPVILAVGGYEDAIYEQIFKTFAKGGISFNEALIVEGTHNIDDYSLEELQKFDAVLLHGYGYKSKNRAWKLLQNYVENGGSLYVDTGWQYWTPDWETADAPAILPVKNLEWTNFGIVDAYEIDDPNMVSSSAGDHFSPLAWADKPWDVSFPSEGLRDWASPVLSVEGSPLIVAGEYGKGRVIWSGMNLIGHAGSYDNAAEREFFGQLIHWLTSAPPQVESASPMVVREHPDHIRFVLEEPIEEGMSLLWREAYSPDWRASVDIGGRKMKIPIYPAGPGMMLLRLPSINVSGAVIEMDFSLGWIGWAGIGVSLLTIGVLLVYVASPTTGQSVLERLLRFRRSSVSKGWVEWLHDQSSAALEPLINASHIDEASEDLHAARVAGSRETLEQWNIDGDIGVDVAEVEALWTMLVDKGKVPAAGSTEADKLIRRWRLSRSKDPTEGKA